MFHKKHILGLRTLIVAWAVLAFTLPTGVVRGQSATPNSDVPADLPKFDVASIRPHKDPGPGFWRFNSDGISVRNQPIETLLRWAFDVEDDRIIGAPSWAKSNRYDIEAKVTPENAAKVDALNREARRAMLIPLLAERLNMKYHREARELPTYALVRAKSGTKLRNSNPEDFTDRAGSPFSGTPPKGIDTRGGMEVSQGRIVSHDTTIVMLAKMLSPQLGRTVVDKTGLTGRYDYTLQWTPDNNVPSGAADTSGDVHATDADAAGVSLFTAIQEQLGLKLESEKGSVDVIVIDHIELPSAN